MRKISEITARYCIFVQYFGSFQVRWRIRRVLITIRRLNANGCLANSAHIDNGVLSRCYLFAASLIVCSGRRGEGTVATHNPLRDESGIPVRLVIRVNSEQFDVGL